MKANRTEYLFSVNTRTPPTMAVGSGEEFTIEVRGAAVHFVGVGSSVEEATEDAARRAVNFTVARSSLSREELLSIIGELRVGTSPRPVMATRLRPRRAAARCWLERRPALEADRK